jgi:hypothetical protein
VLTVERDEDENSRRDVQRKQRGIGEDVDIYHVLAEQWRRTCARGEEHEHEQHGIARQDCIGVSPPLRNREFAGDPRKNRATRESMPGALNASRHANAVVKRKSTPSGRCSARRGVSAILRRRTQHRHRKARGARTRCSSRAPGRGRPRRSTARRPRLRAGAMGLHERAWRVGRATAHTLADSWGRATSISMHACTSAEVALTSSPSTPHVTLDEKARS